MTFIERLRRASPDRLSMSITALRLIWVALALALAGYMFGRDFPGKWLALAAAAMTMVEAYIHLYCLERTRTVILVEAAASVAGMVCFLMAAFALGSVGGRPVFGFG